MHITAGAATDVGTVREHNEDAHLVRERLFAVADGMGGHAAGEVASALAIEALAGLADLDPARPQDVLAAVAAANERILASVEAHPERRGMGTTLTGVALAEDSGAARWVVFNVGDSRVYRLVSEGLEQVTVDHSEVQELLEAGLISADEAAVHPARNIITRSLGMGATPEPDVWVLEPAEEDTFVICSDGLTNEVSDADLADLVEAEPDPQAAAEGLCRAAVQGGGRDNVTVVVVRSRRSATGAVEPTDA